MNTRVLIVEDNTDLKNIFSEAFLDAGFDVSAVGTASAALLQFEKYQPHIMVLDIHLPGLSGLDILPYVRKQYPDTIIIVASANHSAVYHPQIHLADQFLPKPVDVCYLLDLAQDLYNHYAASA